jgi:hypothetical protein
MLKKLVLLVLQIVINVIKLLNAYNVKQVSDMIQQQSLVKLAHLLIAMLVLTK